jgi:molybdenum cofactor cytidylyltransferase
MGSIQAGLARLDPAADVLLWPVDRPLAAPATVAALTASGEGGGEDEIRVPVAGGRRGHPILLPASLRDPLLAAAPDESLRDRLRASGAARRGIEVDDVGIHFDLDTEDRVAEAVRWWEGRRFPG